MQSWSKVLYKEDLAMIFFHADPIDLTSNNRHFLLKKQKLKNSDKLVSKIMIVTHKQMEVILSFFQHYDCENLLECWENGERSLSLRFV